MSTERTTRHPERVPVSSRQADAAELHGFHERAVNRGVNPLVYWPVRFALKTVFHLYFRIERIGRRHIPDSGPLILASNHRSFLDPFVIGTLTRRPVYYVAKEELFNRRWQAWVLNSLGAFPIRRGASDAEAMSTARSILARGDCVVIFPEGTRVRPGPLGEPRRGVGRLALETGARVVPVAVFGTEDVRRGWRIRPRKVRMCCGRPLAFPSTDEPTPRAATAVTDRVWACVSLQWEWLGGTPAPREPLAAPDVASAETQLTGTA
jgi:1-acyl-sn-glycerol-3-phosphate acyltransferase